MSLNDVKHKIFPFFSALIIQQMSKAINLYPSNKMIWKPNIAIVASRFQYKLQFLLFHYLPAFFIDIGLRLSGSKLRLVKIYSKIYYHLLFFSFFVGSTWNFSDGEMRKIYLNMSSEDHEEFPCIVNPDDFQSHSFSTTKGLRKYFFKESDEDLLKARKKLRMLKIAHDIFWVFIYSSFVYIFSSCAIRSLVKQL